MSKFVRFDSSEWVNIDCICNIWTHSSGGKFCVTAAMSGISPDELHVTARFETEDMANDFLLSIVDGE